MIEKLVDAVVNKGLELTVLDVTLDRRVYVYVSRMTDLLDTDEDIQEELVLEYSNGCDSTLFEAIREGDHESLLDAFNNTFRWYMDDFTKDGIRELLKKAEIHDCGPETLFIEQVYHIITNAENYKGKKLILSDAKEYLQ